jgi:hypothetical protein
MLQTNRVEDGRTYTWHYYGGSYKRVPEDWRFPRCGVSDLWRQWWIGDSVRSIPPLRNIKIEDVSHLDTVPLGEEEQHGRTGKHKDKRRQASKILSDMKKCMTFIHEKVVQRGKFEPEITLASVDRMFKAIVDCFDKKERDAQKRWTSVLRDIHTKKIT